MGNEVDALAFLDKVLKTSEKTVQDKETTDIKDHNWQEAYPEEAKWKQNIAEVQSMKETQWTN